MEKITEIIPKSKFNIGDTLYCRLYNDFVTITNIEFFEGSEIMWVVWEKHGKDGWWVYHAEWLEEQTIKRSK